MEQRSPKQRQGALRLILGTGFSEQESSVVAVSFEASGARELRAEAIEIEAWYGPNAYSRYLTKHGRRPDRVSAATIGRLLGLRVRADDGSLQPKRSKAEQKQIAAREREHKAAALLETEIEHLTSAISSLNQISSDPCALLTHPNSQLDDGWISTQFRGVLTWLNRFANGRAACGATNGNPKPA